MLQWEIRQFCVIAAALSINCHIMTIINNAIILRLWPLKRNASNSLLPQTEIMQLIIMIISRVPLSSKLLRHG